MRLKMVKKNVHFCITIIFLAPEKISPYIGDMEQWKQQLEQGKHSLHSLEHQQAIVYLKEALSVCPVENSLGLSEILFFMGIAFRNLGHHNYAYRCWENAAMLRDRQESEYDLDWRAFYRIQLIKYLSTKNQQQFGSLAESDMIHDLIKLTWEEVKTSYDLMQSDFHDRCAFYRTVRISFPRIDADGINGRQMGQIISFSRSSGKNGKK